MDTDATPEITYDRSVSIPGQDDKVSAFFDAEGVLNLQCTTDSDCLAAQGYFHAADRFFQMDLRRRFARGRLSELTGPILIDTDQQSRTLLATQDGAPIIDQLWATADIETKAAIEAYSRGVNAWLDDVRNERNGAKLSAEYDFMIIDKTVLTDWEPLDSIACFLPVLEQLTNHTARDLLAGEAALTLGAEMGADLFGVRVPSPSSTLPGSQAKRAATKATQAKTPSAKWLAAIRKARSVSSPERVAEEVGSNSWIVGPSLAGGKALMANDPHLTMSNPAIWYLVHIDSKTSGSGTLHIAGASFAGMPGIIYGQNESLAWGVTTSYYDQGDVYLETLNAAGDAVIFNGVEVPIINVEHTYIIAGKDPETHISQYVPHHGPILSIDTDAGTAVSLRWTGQDADTDFNFLWKMWTATTTEEAKTALNDVTTIGQNWVIADTAGDIAWMTNNRVPTRPWMATTPAWLPLPGDGSAEWGPFVEYSELPQATNPTAGYVATANNDMTGALFDGDPSNDGQSAAQDFAADGYRHERISEVIEAKAEHTLADMQELQHDTKSLYGERITPLLLADLDSVGVSGEAAALIAALEGWDFFCPTGFTNSDPENAVASTDSAILASAKGCAAFHVVWPRLRKLTFGDELTAAGANFYLGSSPMAVAFLRPDALSQTYWDDVSTDAVTETRAQIVLQAVEEAGLFLVGKLGADSSAWLWGALHSLYLPADLFDGAGVEEFSEGPFMHDGALSTVDVAAPRNDLRDNYWHSHGASNRLACEASEAGVSCTYQLPGGQRHHRGDAFYRSLLERWLSHEPTPLPFSIAELIGSATETVLVE